MVHVSKMSRGFVKHPDEVVQIGQAVTVRVLEQDQQGRINLTMVLEDDGGGEQPREHQPRQGYDRGPREGQGRDMRRNDQPLHPLSQQFRREKFQTKPRKRFR
jgi:transcriptional accessory protein Tex/SPT6